MTNEDTTDFDEHFAKISSYIVDTLHGVLLEMTEDEKEQFRIQVISNQYAERLLSEAEKTETYRGLSKIDILHTVFSVLTIRRVYEELEQEGFVTSQVGIGTFVSTSNLELLRDSKRRLVEQKMQDMIQTAKSLKITKEELNMMMDILYEEG